MNTDATFFGFGERPPQAPVALEDFPPYSPAIPRRRLVEFDSGGLAMLVGKTGEESFAYAPTGLTVVEEIEGQPVFRFINNKRELQAYNPDNKAPREVRKYQDECAAATASPVPQAESGPRHAKPRRSLIELGKTALLQRFRGLFNHAPAATPEQRPATRHSRPAVWHDLVGPAPEGQAPVATPSPRFVPARFDGRFVIGPHFTDPAYLFGPEQNSTRPSTDTRTEGLGDQLAAMVAESEAARESMPEPDRDDFIMRRLAARLGLDGFVSAYQLKALHPDAVQKAISDEVMHYQRELRRARGTTFADKMKWSELAATLTRLEEICRSNGLPFDS